MFHRVLAAAVAATLAFAPLTISSAAPAFGLDTVVKTDAGEAVHLHGYNIEKPVTPGTPLRIPFTAELPGRFELELHHPDVVLAVLEVKP